MSHAYDKHNNVNMILGVIVSRFTYITLGPIIKLGKYDTRIPVYEGFYLKTIASLGPHYSSISGGTCFSFCLPIFTPINLLDFDCREAADPASLTLD